MQMEKKCLCFPFFFKTGGVYRCGEPRLSMIRNGMYEYFQSEIGSDISLVSSVLEDKTGAKWVGTGAGRLLAQGGKDCQSVSGGSDSKE